MMRVGAYGSPTRRTYGVLGDETVVAARLMSQAGAGQILVSAPVAEVATRHYQLVDLGQMKLKGKPEPQPVWAVLARQGQTGEQLSKRYTMPLVGRAGELAALRTVLANVLNGQGQLMRIEGAAGVGKSHLVATFVQEAAAHGPEIITAACQSTSQDIAYFSGRQLARNLLHITGDTPLSEKAQIEQVATALAALNANWLLRLPLLGDLLGLAIPDNPTTAAFDPRLRQEALISLVVDIVQTWAGQHPLVLLFEDIHWMDEATQGILLALGRVVQNTPMLLVVVQSPPAREEERFLAEVAALPDQTHLRLAELAPDGLAALVRSRLQNEISPLALDLIQRQTQGNPFFAEELVDALCDARYLIADGDVWSLAPHLVETLRNAGCLRQHADEWILAADAPLAAVDLGVPDTVQGIVLARLDRLPEAAKLTLKVASVIGAVFEYELLAQAHPLANAKSILQEHTALFLAREFARLETPEPRLTYIFKHNITQEVVYQSLLEDQRHELHLSVAGVLEMMHPDQIEDLAFHYTNSNLNQRAVRDRALYYLDAAGQRAKREYANETALSYFNRALAIEGRWPWLKGKIEVLHILGRRQDERAALDLLKAAPNVPVFDGALLWGEYYEAISEYDEAKQAIEQALAVSQQIGDAEGEARCLARLGVIAWSRGDYEAAEQRYTQALRVITDEEHFRDVKAEVHWGLGLVFRRQGNLEEAQYQFEQDLALNRQLGNRQKEARALNALGHVASLKRSFRPAIAYYRQALEIRRAIGDREGIGAGLLSLAQGYGNLGDYGESEPLLHEALSIQRAINNRWWEMLTLNDLGILYLMIGNLDQARQVLSDGLQISRQIGDESGQAYLLCNLGQVVREQGDLVAAEEILQEGLRLAQRQGDVHLEAIHYSDLALVSLRAQRFNEAIERATSSLVKFRTLALPLSTTADLATLAYAHLSLGDLSVANDHAHAALQLLDECGGEGPDFPHRDYWVCSQVLGALGHKELAKRALQSALSILMRQADKISDIAMRKAYLENVSVNRQILQAIENAPLAL
jgi:tetratricopeptide (TPR) repeat protein